MARILVDFQGMNDLQNRLNGITGELHRLQADIARSLNNLDWEVSQKENIDQQLRQAAKQALELAERSRQMKLIVNRAINDFSRTDDKCAKQAEEITSELESIWHKFLALASEALGKLGLSDQEILEFLEQAGLLFVGQSTGIHLSSLSVIAGLLTGKGLSVLPIASLLLDEGVRDGIKEFLNKHVETDTLGYDKDDGIAYLGKGSIQGQSGSLKGEADVYVGDITAEGECAAGFWHEKTGEDVAGVKVTGRAQAAVLEGKAEGSYGDEDFGLFAQADGKVLTAKAEAGIEANIESGNLDVGAKAEVGASVFEGEASTGFNIFGWEIEVGIEGSALGAQAGAEIGYTDGRFRMGAKAELVAGGGFWFSIGRSKPAA